jgi:NAD-dependent dihydropyrimidine dehydrogenase PreA subunit
MKREIIKIDEEKCTGCGLCIPACPEGALQIIDNKARLVSDLMCDGLGACLGECPEGAIEVEVREAEAYDEKLVMVEMVKKGRNTVVAHLKHLQDHGEFAFMNQAISYLQENEGTIDFPLTEVLAEVSEEPKPQACGGGCPGSAIREFNVSLDDEEPKVEVKESSTGAPSELRQWPVQMHLINPNAAYFQKAPLVLAADCVAFSMGDFHSRFLKGRSLTIACPKLDSGKDIYINKLVDLIDKAEISSLDVIVMEVPCCSGLLQMAKIARDNAVNRVPINHIIISVEGKIISEKAI